MPERLPGDNPRWTRKYVSPALDFILREELKDDIAARLTVGGDHPQKTKYPDHKFCGFGEADKGTQVAYFCKTRDAQEAYNFEAAQVLGNEWPEIRQTWVITRASFKTNGLVQISAPPSELGTWTFIGAQQGRLPPELDGLFVEVIHTWMDLTDPLRGEVIDLDSNARSATERTIVAAGTVATPVGADGTYSIITPINTLLSFKDIRHATGLAGRAVNGKAQRTLRLGEQWPLPSVLAYIAIFPVHTDPADIYSPISRYIVVPKFLVNGGAYPCKITIVEKWFSKEPILAESGGDADWDSTKETSPLLLMPTALLETPIDFGGVELGVNVGPCLHGSFRFWDSGYADFFPATTYTRWPATFLGRVQMQRDNGGYLVQEWYITPPAEGRVTSLNLRQYGVSTATTAEVEWEAAASGNPETRLDVATDPNFESGWLEGYRNKLVTPATNTPPLRHTITGLVRGRIYHCRVRRSGDTSEIVQITGAALPELAMSIGGTPVLTASTVNLGSAEVGGRAVVTLRLSSIGLIAVSGIVAEVSGTDAGVFSLGTLPTSLTSGATADLELRFDPLAAGTLSCTLTITSEAVDSPITLTLSATGTAGEISVEQPAGTAVASGGTVAFGSVTTGTAEKVFKIRNVGNATLRDLAVSITGTNAADWTVITPLTSSEIEAAGYQHIELQFDPIESEDAFGARTAVLNIASNDGDENPNTITLTGTSASPTAPGALDSSFNPNANGVLRAAVVQPDGDVILVGDFTTIGGTTRNRIARVNFDGTLDTGFNPNANGVVRCAIVQPDGTILIGGDFTTIGGTTRNRIALLNADGTLASWYPTGGVDAAVYTMARKANGAVWIGGPFNTVGGSTRKRIALINSDATINATDPSVSLGISIPATADVRGLVLDAAEKLVLCGYYLATVDWGFVARLNADGTVDTGFIGQVYFNGAVNAVSVLADGSVVAGGVFTTMATVTGTFPSITPGTPVYNRSRIIVLDSAGVPTSTLLDANGIVHTLTLQTDGRVIIGGAFTTLNTVARLRLARVLADLTLEAAFDPQASGTVLTLALAETGEIVTGGDFATMGGVTRNNVARLLNSASEQSLTVVSASVVRWLQSGSYPASKQVIFEADTGSGYGALGGTTAAIAGGWEVTGLSLSGTGTVRARTVSTDSHSCGLIEETRAYDVSPNISIASPSGDIATGGTLAYGSVQNGKTLDIVITITNRGLSDLSLTGTPKAALSGTHAAEWSVIAQPASPIAAGQSALFTLRFSPASEGAKSATLTVASDDAGTASYTVALTGTATAGVGSVDAGYQPTANGAVLAMLVSDEIRLGGEFTTVNGLNRNRFARLSTAGAALAQTGTGANGRVTCMVQLLNGKWLIGGEFTTIQGVARTRLARLNADGSLDTSFNLALTGSTGYTTPSCFLLLPSGDVMLGGRFQLIGGQSRSYLVKITEAGTVDAGFVPAYTGVVHDIALQAGKLLVASATGIQRLTLAGALDATWSYAGNSDVLKLAVQRDDKVIIRVGQVVRLTSAGAADATFTTLTAPFGPMQLQCDGALFVGFATGALPVRRYDTTGTQDAAFVSTITGTAALALDASGRVYVGTKRLINDAAAAALTVSATRAQWLRSGTAPEAQWTAFDLSEDAGTTWTRLGTGTRIAGGWELTGIALPQAGRVRARAYVAGALQDETLIYTGLPVPDISIERGLTVLADDANTSFTGRLVGQTVDVVFTIRNTGNATLSGLVAVASGDYSVTSLGATSLDAGQTTSVTVRFAPTAVGTRVGLLTITSNVPGSKSPFVLTLLGSGITTPTATTTSATLVTATQARLRGSFKANDDSGKTFVEYKRVADASWTRSAEANASGFLALALDFDITGLTANTAYHYRTGVYNNVTTSAAPVYGAIVTFNTTA